jgi:YbgC/YbaW family acyl-CoA thioester hydrolase
MPRFSTTRKVQFVDTDVAGIVHFSNFYRYMEEAELEWFESLNLKIYERQSDGATVGWPRVRAECSFEAPAFYLDQLEIDLDVERVGERSLTLAFVFKREGTLIARGSLTTVCCRQLPGGALHSIEIPSAWRAALEDPRGAA